MLRKMEEEKEYCKKCHTGYLQPTDNPRKFVCDFCGWERLYLTLQEFVERKG